MAWALAAAAMLALACAPVGNAQTSFEAILPGLTKDNSMSNADFNAKLQSLCNTIGLCLPLKPVAPPSPPAPPQPGVPCSLPGQPYIGRGCPYGSFCTHTADPSRSTQGPGILATVGQASNRVAPVNCTVDTDCAANQFCAANAGDDNLCLEVVVPTGPCYPGGSVDLRAEALAPSPDGTIGDADAPLPAQDTGVP